MAIQNPQEKLDSNLILMNWRGEMDSVHLYRYLATREKDEAKAQILREMADSEGRHAKVMELGLREMGVAIPTHRLRSQTRIMKGLARVLGPKAVYPLLHGTELTGSAEYATQDTRTASLASEERSHARTLGQLQQESQSSHAERWHRSAGGGSLRAAVFGVSDGLVSNLSLVMGFAGASANPDVVLLAGMAGLLAGASSMAAGEYVSMKAQRELFERQIELERAELAVTKDEEIQELSYIYRAKGIPKIEADRIAARLGEDPEVALDALVREELGLDPTQLGSPIGAGVSSFLAFAVGAILPVLPFLFGASSWHVIASLLLAGGGMFLVGAMLSLFTGRSMLFSGTRQLLIGGVAGALTFGLGSLLGVSAS